MPDEIITETLIENGLKVTRYTLPDGRILIWGGGDDERPLTPEQILTMHMMAEAEGAA